MKRKIINYLLLFTTIFSVGVMMVKATAGTTIYYKTTSDSEKTEFLASGADNDYIQEEVIDNDYSKLTVKQNLYSLELNEFNHHILFGNNVTLDEVIYYEKDAGGCGGYYDKLIIETDSTIKLKLYERACIQGEEVQHENRLVTSSNIKDKLVISSVTNDNLDRFLKIDTEKYDYTFENEYLVVSVKKQPQTYVDNNVSVITEDKLNGDYLLSVSEMDTKDVKLDNHIYVVGYDIHMLDKTSGDIVSIENTNLKIKVPVQKKEYDKYVVVYLKDGEIVETIDATYEEGYVVFNTTHLSEYVVFGQEKKTSIENPLPSDPEEDIPVPETADNIIFYVRLLGFSILEIMLLLFYTKKVENH